MHQIKRGQILPNTYDAYVVTILLWFSVCMFPFTVLAQDRDTPFEKGTAYLKMSKLDDAVLTLTEAIRQNPGHVEAYNNRGLAYYRQNELEQASKDFQKALDMTPDNEEAGNNLGVLLCKLGRYDQALTCLKNALAGTEEEKPFHADVWNNLAFAYWKIGQYKEAMHAFRKALEIAQKSGPKQSPTSSKKHRPRYVQRVPEQFTDGRIVLMKFYSE